VAARNARLPPWRGLTPLSRALIRIRGGHSGHPRDVERDLRRVIKRAAGRDGRATAGAGRGPAARDARLRALARAGLRRGTVSTAPELEPGRYALVLVAFAPAATEQFVRHGAAAHLTPATVGSFRPTTEPAIALAGTLALWLDIYAQPVALTPPLLHVGGGWRVADLGLEWPLAPDGGG
jgi:hypothetical protein